MQRILHLNKLCTFLGRLCCANTRKLIVDFVCKWFGYLDRIVFSVICIRYCNVSEVLLVVYFLSPVMTSELSGKREAGKGCHVYLLSPQNLNKATISRVFPPILTCSVEWLIVTAELGLGLLGMNIIHDVHCNPALRSIVWCQLCSSYGVKY